VLHTSRIGDLLVPCRQRDDVQNGNPCSVRYAPIGVFFGEQVTGLLSGRYRAASQRIAPDIA
jgi:hypothetical protein